jgi:hypothetical protein
MQAMKFLNTNQEEPFNCLNISLRVNLFLALITIIKLGRLNPKFA